MADIAVENNETPVVEKEVEDVETPKVVDDEEKVVVENGKADEEEAAEAVPENGTTEAEPEALVTSTPAEGDDAVVADDAAPKNGDSTDAAPAEAVKRKITADVDATDAPATEDVVCPTPEKKSKLDEAAAKENGAAENEAVA